MTRKQDHHRSRLSDADVLLAVQLAKLKPINDEIWKRQVSQYPVYCVEAAIRALRTELENTK